MNSFALVGPMLALASLAAAPHSAQAQPTTSSAATSCAAVGDLNFVCGPINVEDFVPIEGGRWLVAGSYKPGSAGLYLIDTTAKTYKPVALSIAAKPDSTYDCKAPDLKGLQTHGLDIVPNEGGVSTVYAVNHGGRESVEVFRLNAAKATAEWVGCAVLPSGANPNSVAALPGGGFVVTKFLDNNDKEAFQHILSGQVNGVVYRWMPGKGFSEVPGTQLSGDNGILASRDGKWLYVCAYGTHEVYRLPVSGAGQRTSVKVDFNPDNLRWAPDGTILATGQFVNAQNLASKHGWAAVRIDPETLHLTALVKEPGYPEFDDATTAVQVGKTLWFGTFRGDRIAYRARP